MASGTSSSFQALKHGARVLACASAAALPGAARPPSPCSCEPLPAQEPQGEPSAAGSAAEGAHTHSQSPSHRGLWHTNSHSHRGLWASLLLAHPPLGPWAHSPSLLRSTALAEAARPQDRAAGGANPQGAAGDAGGEDKEGASNGAPSNSASNSHTARWRVFTDQGREMFSQGRMREAERYLSRALEEARLGFGERDAHVASACNNLAELYRILGRPSEAEPLYLSASQLLKEEAAQLEATQPEPEAHPQTDAQGWAQGPGSPLGAGTGAPLGGGAGAGAPLGGPLGFRGGSGPVFEDPSAAAAAAAAPLGHAGLTAGAAFALHNLGGLYLRQGQLQKAADCYQEALSIKKKAMGEAHPEYADTMFHLAEVYRVQGKRQEATALLQQSIQILEDSEGGDVQRIARRTLRLVQLLMRGGAWEDAEMLLRRGLHMLESSAQCGPQSQAAAAFAEGVAECLMHRAGLRPRPAALQGEGEGAQRGEEPLAHPGSSRGPELESALLEAQELLQRSLQVKQKSLGKAHFSVAQTLVRLGDVLLALAQGLQGSGGQQQLQQQQQLLEDAQTALRRAQSLSETEWARAQRAFQQTVALSNRAQNLDPRRESGSEQGHGQETQQGREGPRGGDSQGPGVDVTAGETPSEQRRAATRAAVPLLCLVRSLEAQARVLVQFPEAFADVSEAQLRFDAMVLLRRAQAIAKHEQAVLATSPELQVVLQKVEEHLERLQGEEGR